MSCQTGDGIPEPLVLLDEWSDYGDAMVAPADPDPLRGWRTARYVVAQKRGRDGAGPSFEAHLLDRQLSHGWQHDGARLTDGPWIEIPQPQPYATGRAELAARQMARSLVLIADYCGGPGEAKRALGKLPPAFVESARTELRAEEKAARERREVAVTTAPAVASERYPRGWHPDDERRS